MDDVALANYITGSDFRPVEAGRLDRQCAELLGVAAGTQIVFSDYTLLKLHQKHGHINFSHYCHMHSILLHGFLSRGRHPNLLDFWWIDKSNAEATAYFVVLKATKKREIFVATFHRISLKEAGRLRRKAIREGRLIREQS